jgi:hypothetical protein
VETAEHGEHAVGHRRGAGQHQAGYGRMAVQQLDGDMPTERPAEDGRMPDVELVEDFADRPGETPKIVGSPGIHRVGRVAVTGKVERDEAEPIRHGVGELFTKHVLGRTGAMD